jgi:hypothetical protein
MEVKIETIDDAIDYIVDIVGSDFERAFKLANSILDDPGGFTGPQSVVLAKKLAVYRYKLGIAAQWWKQEATRTKKQSDRLIKDALMTACSYLEEVINTLKLEARQDYGLARG